MIFRSVEDLERYIEPFDLDDLLVYDSDGSLFRLTVTLTERGIERVCCRREPIGSAVAALRQALFQYLARVDNKRFATDADSTAALIQRLSEVVGYTS